jgi:hypothetical protein
LISAPAAATTLPGTVRFRQTALKVGEYQGQVMVRGLARHTVDEIPSLALYRAKHYAAHGHESLESAQFPVAVFARLPS